MADKFAALGQVHPSLANTASVYVVMQVRTVTPGHLRFQGLTEGNKWEHDVTVSVNLSAWVKTVDHTRKSVASSTPYAPCLVKREDGTTDKVRVQIAGPQRNREFGVVFLLTDTLLYQHAKHGGGA